MSRSKEHIRIVCQIAKQLGYEGPIFGRHIKFFHPKTKQTVCTSLTPSDFRATTNCVHRLKRLARTHNEKGGHING